MINPNLDDDYKKLLYARLEHILLNYKEALEKYNLIKNQNKYFENAQFWIKRIQNSQSKLKSLDIIL